MKVETTKNVISQGFTILVYGEAGTGKTFDIQHVKNPIVISAEGGLLTLNHLDIPFIEVNDWQGFLEALKYVFNDEAMKDKTICIDSLSVLSDYCYDMYSKMYPNDTRKPYQMLAEVFPKIIDLIQKKNRNVYIIAQQTADKDENGLIMKYVPLIKGNASKERIPYVFDIILPKRILPNSEGKMVRCIYNNIDSKYLTKSRIPLSKTHYRDISEVFAELNNQDKKEEKDGK